jgi:biotin-dependent carboxylase-like uncharacterized protein
MDSALSPSLLRRVQKALLEREPTLDVALGDGSLLVVGEIADAVVGQVLGSNLVEESEPVTHCVRVHYGGADLREVAEQTGMTESELIARHSAATYEVRFPGFMPGFAYLGGLPAELRVPRRPSPRPRVPAGSVAIAAEYCGIYPWDGPGGWNLLGRVLDQTLFDVRRRPPALLGVGDLVRFEATTPAEGAGPVLRERAQEPQDPVLRVLSSSPLTTIQDRGRFGALRLGLPPSGALDPERYEATTLSVGARDSAALEIVMGSLTVEALREVLVAIDGEGPRLLRAGEVMTVNENGFACRYLAVAGGFSSTEVLGSSSTLVSAKIGGFLGRGVRRGDVLGCANRPNLSPARRATPQRGASMPLRIHRGPDFMRFTSDSRSRMQGRPFRVSRLADRTGMRLSGASLGENSLGSGRSAPMVRGAIQVTPDGSVIVLGPDHPTTGGYPVIAVLDSEDWGRLARLRPDSTVQFEWSEPER